MKNRTHVIIIISIVLLVMLGGWLAYCGIYKQTLGPDTYYTLQEAKWLLDRLKPEETVTSDEEDMKGFTVEDAKQGLQQILNMSESQVEEELNTKKDSEQNPWSMLTGKANRKVLSREEFQQYYENLIERTGTEQVQIETRLILEVQEAEEASEDAGCIVVTDCGKYTVCGANDSRNKRMQQQILDAENQLLHVYTADGQILEITEQQENVATIENVWIESSTDTEIQVFMNGYHKSYPCKLSGSEAIVQNSLADITMGTQGVTDIVLKSDVITAKVLAVAENGVEIEGYGILPVSEHYKIYKIYGELAVEPTSQILVGYTTTNFVVADGVIEAALITEPIHAENIRVVLGNSDYTSLIHPSVTVTSDGPYTMQFQGQSKTFEAGEVLELTPDCGYMAEGRVVITSDEENGTIQICSITRNGIEPCYRGSIEVAPYENQGLTIVNELSLEEYLYTVVPSEMPTSYGEEALQVQAICARGYAYAKMQDGTYARYGAHLDDSTMTQVYNAVAESEESILAVKDTYGMVPFYDGSVIEAYFFSTSCGVTCNNQDVWDGAALPYLQDKLECEAASEFDFSEETAFRSFIDDSSTYQTYEEDCSLYRWSIEYTPEEMTAAIDATLKQRYETNPEKILTLQADGSYQSVPVDTVGTVTEIEVTNRGKSGIVKEITVTGTAATIKVTGQTNARALMTPAQVVIVRQDGSQSSGWSLLPSPFYYVKKNDAGNYVICGGGFGHGVGMSQNGTRAMTELGYSAEDIIKHYYTGVEIVNIYQ